MKKNVTEIEKTTTKIIKIMFQFEATKQQTIKLFEKINYRYNHLIYFLMSIEAIL